MALVPRYFRGRSITSALFFSILVFFAALGPTYAKTLKVQAAEDSFVSEVAPITPHGDLIRITTTGETGIRKRGYIKFNVTGLPAGAVITGATLKMLSRITTAGNVGIYRALNNDWSESTLTWNAQPWWNVALISNVAQHTTNQWSSFDLHGDISGAGTYSYVVSMPAGEENRVRFHSKESAASRAPYLEIKYEVHADRARAVYAHTPSPATDTTARLNAGWATGAALYGSSSNLWDYDDMRSILTAHPEGIDLMVMAKKFTPESLQTIVDNTTPAQRARMRFTNGQEPEDDTGEHGYQTEAQRAEFRRQTQIMIAALRPAGIEVGVHLQTWTTNEGNHLPWGGKEIGPETIKAFMPQRDDSFGSEPLDFVGGSMYDYHQNQSARVQLTPFIAAVRAAQAGVPIHMSAIGWSIHVPSNDNERNERAVGTDDALATIEELLPNSDYGWFDFKWCSDDDQSVCENQPDLWKDYRTLPSQGGDPLLLDVLKGYKEH